MSCIIDGIYLVLRHYNLSHDNEDNVTLVDLVTEHFDLCSPFF